MKKVTIFAIIIAVLLLGVFIRFVQVALDSSGEGNGADSPDKKFHAFASSSYHKKFWGGTHNYYEFTIESAGGRRIHRIVMDEPPEGMIGWRGEGLIQWSPDSSSVTYTFKGTQLTLSVNP